MTTDEPTTQVSVGLAISELRRSVDVGFAKVDGRLDLLVQRGEHTERTMDDHATQLRHLDERADTLERTAVTHDQLDRRDRKHLTIAGLVVAVVGVAVGVLTPIVMAGLGIGQ